MVVSLMRVQALEAGIALTEGIVFVPPLIERIRSSDAMSRTAPQPPEQVRQNEIA